MAKKIRRSDGRKGDGSGASQARAGAVPGNDCAIGPSSSFMRSVTSQTAKPVGGGDDRDVQSEKRSKAASSKAATGGTRL